MHSSALLDRDLVLPKGSSVGEALVAWLEARGVDLVFGIPGVHTVEMYRGLGRSAIRHITPRHEQGAGFMADGYARASGRPGVAFVITGPGVTNILTPMGQARADSIPMLVISGVNEERHLGLGLGHLHELPDQHGLVSTLACQSDHVTNPQDLFPALEGLLDRLQNGRPGPVHLQVPLDVFGETFDAAAQVAENKAQAHPDADLIARIAERLQAAKRPVLVAGGGCLGAEADLIALAEALDAPVVQTINARGLMHEHPLRIPASPSLSAVKSLFAEADLVLALGTELGPTDFDIYNTGHLPELPGLIRVDIDAEQLARHRAEVALQAKVEQALPLLLDALEPRAPQGGAGQAATVRRAALAELSPEYQQMVAMMEAARDTLPGSIIVGDSTQPLYAANMYYGHDHARGWFNSSVGYGTLGYAIPAAIGAALGAPERPVVCVTGDGGAQFTLPEMMVAVEERLPVTFIIWNNAAFGEIATAMESAGVDVVGCSPTPPDFALQAQAFGMEYIRCGATPTDLAQALHTRVKATGPCLIEIRV
jgi:acetolactate synthase-1/2/3 large subunit